MALNEYPKGEAGQPVYSEFGVNHIGFVVDDLDGIDQRLQSKGYPSDSAFQEEGEFRRRHYYKDGNGMEWEFVEYLSEEVALRNNY